METKVKLYNIVKVILILQHQDTCTISEKILTSTGILVNIDQREKNSSNALK